MKEKQKIWIWLQIQNGNPDRLENIKRQVHKVDKGPPVCEVWPYLSY